MKKIEIIWREILYQAIEKKRRQFTQKALAAQFGFSTSTVFQALKTPRRMGAVRVGGRHFIVEDVEKLLYHWASIRNLNRESILQGRVDLPVFEVEGRMPPEVVFGGFTAAREILRDLPADYDKVYVYVPSEHSEVLARVEGRFELTKGTPNLCVLAGDRFLTRYGLTTTFAQTFVDLWNISEWYAKEYIQALRGKFRELLP